jgi:hypothetical protein
MTTLTCPRCGNSGAMRGDDRAFEPVWQAAREHFPVRRCRQCGAGIIICPRFLVGMRPTLIPDDNWHRMEQMFAVAVGGAPSMGERFVCEECGCGFKSASALETHAFDAHS